MAWSDRRDLIEAIEAKRGTRVVCYVTSDRRNASGKMATDAIPWLYGHIARMGPNDKLDLLVYSTGGATMVAWRIVTMFREFAAQLGVLVPYKAHSAATLIALGADEIVMLPSSELSPVDPSTESPFNPVPHEGMPAAPIVVEDVQGYFELAKDSRLGGLGSADALSEVFKRLALKVHPLALGHVFRAREQIRMLATKLLQLHMPEDAEQIGQITRKMTGELLSHDYPISRAEAEAMGLRVVRAEASGVGDPLWALYEGYRDDLKLLEPWEQESALGDQEEAQVELDLAVVESTDRSDAFTVRKMIRRVPIPQMVGLGAAPIMGIGYQEQILRQCWQTKESG